MFKKTFLLIVVFLVSIGTTYYVLKPNRQKQKDKIFTAIKKGQFSAAEDALKSLAAFFPEEAALYRGYLEQIRNRFEASDQFLQAAFYHAQKTGKQELMLESLLARCNNAFYKGKDQELVSLIQVAHTLPHSQPALIFFDGLASYLQGNYGEACHAWSQFSDQQPNPWMALSLEHFFPASWQKTRLAHSLIENGNFLAGRAILEKESHNKMGDQNFIALLLGLSYLKEAQQIPFSDRFTYYQMACFYFEHASIKGENREIQRAIWHVEQEAKNLLFSAPDEEKKLWAFPLIKALNDWGAESSLIRIASEVAPWLGRSKEHLALGEKIRHCFSGTPFYTHLVKNMLASLASALKQGEGRDLLALWDHFKHLSNHPKQAAKEIANLTTQEIFDTIKNDTPQLARTRDYITFWLELEPECEEREIFAWNLFYQAKLFWLNEKEEKKGMWLMELALQLSDQKIDIENEIAYFLSDLYEQAESSNLIRRLCVIHDAMEYFNILKLERVSKGTVANYLADADYFYDVQNYSAAKIHAQWVLKLDPKNHRAHRLAGLCCFNLGEYSRALTHLKSLKELDKEAQQALMLSQTFASQEPEEHLCQIDTSFDLDE
jgi:hypothetical protein